MQVLAGMDFVADVDTGSVECIEDRGPAARQFIECFFDETGRFIPGEYIVGLLGAGLWAPSARAEDAAAPDPLPERVEALLSECGFEPEEDWRGTLTALSAEEAPKFERLVRAVESELADSDECTAVDRLAEGLSLARQTSALERQRADTAQTRARDILARPEFQVPLADEDAPSDPDADAPADKGFWQRALDKLAEWLKELFRRDPASERTPPRDVGESGQRAANALVVLLIAATAGVLGWVLWRSWADRAAAQALNPLEVSTQDAASLAADPMNALSRPPEGWAHLADTLAARGEYREAVRGLYLALLSRLHHEGVIHYDSHASNWDYLRQFRGRSEWKPSFRELTLRFDFAWYGNLPVGPEGYRDFRALCAPLLAPSTAPSTAPSEPAHA